MKTAGIIAEYNPLHNGHIYHINKTKEELNVDNLVCIMSGNFVQRGFPSIVDKWTRTKLAIQNGIDLVLELPSAYSIASAEFFAYGAVSILNSIGIVDYLSFGSENDNIDLLMDISRILTSEPNEYKELLKMYISSGISYPKARNKAILSYYSNSEAVNNILNSSNCILAIEYCKSIFKLKSKIQPWAIKRIGNVYNDEDLSTNFSSATALRKSLQNGFIDGIKQNIPGTVYMLLKELYQSGYPHISEEQMFPYLKYKIYTEGNYLNLLPDVSEGLDKKIINELENTNSLKDYIFKIKSKRYTYTRISRILCQYFIGFERYNIAALRSSPCPYCRVLGFNSKGAALLGEIKKKSNIPIVVKPSQNTSESMSLDIQCTKAYSLINEKIRYNEDYYRSPIII